MLTNQELQRNDIRLARAGFAPLMEEPYNHALKYASANGVRLDLHENGSAMLFSPFHRYSFHALDGEVNRLIDRAIVLAKRKQQGAPRYEFVPVTLLEVTL